MTSLRIPSKFELDVAMFNETYKLGNFHSRADVIERMKTFKAMLAEELDEIDDIIAGLELTPPITRLEAMVAYADLLGDIQVYCASEMKRFDIPVQATLDIIMASNASKLGEDGLPIKRADGKVMKGPNYWKPEPLIEAMLLMHQCEGCLDPAAED
jgi:hypothetical protein